MKFATTSNLRAISLILCPNARFGPQGDRKDVRANAQSGRRRKATVDTHEMRSNVPELRYSLQRAVTRVQAPNSLLLDKATLERFLAQCHLRHYPRKTVIIRPGDSANILYFIIDGSVTVSSEDEEGRELILAYINAGEFIGEMGLFVETPQREVTVRTRTPCDLAEISYERLFQLTEGPLREDLPKILFAIGTQLTNRVLN